jgi:NTP pyrophosphatase (non-canonical NTP hydrolase)
MAEPGIDKLSMISAGYMRRFPEGNDPFQILARLLEECGELAQQVHHFEDCGVKRAKYGEPDREHLAKEVRDVLTCTLQIVHYYQIQTELAESIELVYSRMHDEGLL